MTSDRLNLLAPIIFVFGGAFLGVFLLAAILGGLLLAFMMVALALLVSPFMVTMAAVASLRKRRAVPELGMPVIEAAEVEAPPAPIRVDRIPEAPVTRAKVGIASIRVVKVQGTCPLGYTFRLGDRYVFSDDTVTPRLCARAAKALRPLVAQMQVGQQPVVLRPYCQTAQHLVVFELEQARAA